MISGNVPKVLLLVVSLTFLQLSDSDEEEDGPTLIVDVLQAKELAKREWGKTDPFCLLEVAESCRQTRVIKRNFKNPQWRESFLLCVCLSLNCLLAVLLLNNFE